MCLYAANIYTVPVAKSHGASFSARSTAASRSCCDAAFLVAYLRSMSPALSVGLPESSSSGMAPTSTTTISKSRARDTPSRPRATCVCAATTTTVGEVAWASTLETWGWVGPRRGRCQAALSLER